MVKNFKKILNRIITNLNGDRINPGILNPHLITFLGLKKSIINFIGGYVSKNNKILDFGCGNMVYKEFFENKGFKEYVGIDIGDSPEFNKNHIVYGGGKTPFNDKEFDIVLSTQVFEHLEDPIFYGKELERITKKGGYLFISIAHFWEYHAYPKHYYNIFYDSIPLIFKNSKIISVEGDTTNLQNLNQQFLLTLIRKNIFIGYPITLVYNLIIILLYKLKLYKIEPVKYLDNSMTGNIIIVLQVNK